MIYWELFITFFLIGAFTFGGGYAMLPLIKEAVISHGWMSEEQLINFIAVSESTPGPFAVNISTYIGSETGGFLGAVFATLGVVLPSFIIILLIAGWYKKFCSSKIVAGLMSGLKPAVVGLIGTAIVSTGATVLNSGNKIAGAAIFAVMLVLAIKKIHPILIILLSAAAGILLGIMGIY